MLELLVFAAAIASLIAAGLYIRAMVKGQTKPNRVTWLMWSIAPFIATAAEVYSGVTWAVIPVFMTGFAPFLIFCASIFHEGILEAGQIRLLMRRHICVGIGALGHNNGTGTFDNSGDCSRRHSIHTYPNQSLPQPRNRVSLALPHRHLQRRSRISSCNDMELQ